jgi:hypothetical protein
MHLDVINLLMREELSGEASILARTSEEFLPLGWPRRGADQSICSGTGRLIT